MHLSPSLPLTHPVVIYSKGKKIMEDSDDVDDDAVDYSKTFE